MAIGPVELQGAISRVQDFASIRQNEENKGNVDQTNFSQQFHKEVENRSNTVKQGDDASNQQKKFDAKEKGNGQYGGDGGKNRQNQPKDNDGKVTIKGIGSSFDVRV